ncbi:aldehyde dehydrogenase family protein [Herbiconiux sp. VKM Ac-1786]|uniref:aldehyde dehydrogenase family protein n=1 Tax=Herbiconiux sp. VKM Ac-1786 TaxID=2783824 RepID=UPI00188B26CB|nr:aldehyde dehydrogenase family protein [Herbiconiux sp. VKM Ac-1786]MBF4571856.1 aldehyde dehydrogenase family protein [Herbiconiux sp. VKM Ac-1786]
MPDSTLTPPVRAATTHVGEPFSVRNPARLVEEVGVLTRGRAAVAEEAVDRAYAAFPSWSGLGAHERAAALFRAADAIDLERAAIAELLTREHGKVLADATAEITNTAKTIRYYAGLADYVERETVLDDARGRIIERRVAMGVVAVIVPWNYPVLLATLMYAPALLAGNTVVVKLPENAPLALSATLQRLVQELPEGVLSVVAGSGGEVGVALTTHPKVRRVSFTGSTETGRTIMRDASSNLKSLGLELGGNDPAIVLESATVNHRLVQGILRGAFMTSGQVCYAPKRLYVHRSRYSEFVDAFTAAADELVVGFGLDPAVSMGPLNNKAQLNTVKELVEASRREGASVRPAGRYEGVEETDGFFMLPTVVSGLDQHSPLVQQEQFGPAVPILPFDSEEEAVALANDSEYGLAASVWSDDTEHAFGLARRIQAGSVFVNVHRVGASDASMPFGGFKQSGVGRGHGEISVDESTELQIIADRTDMQAQI